MGKKDAGYQLTIDADLSDITGQLLVQCFVYFFKAIQNRLCGLSQKEIQKVRGREVKKHTR